MPNRIIREGWLESTLIDALDAQAERFFIRLCLKADDYGRFHAAPQLLKSLLFPLKEDLRGTDMSRSLAACEKAGLVRCYEVDGKRFLEIRKFDQRLRAKVSKFPPMSGACRSNVSQMTDMCRLDSETESESNTEENTPKPPKAERAAWRQRLGGLFGRRESTKWAEKELRALEKIEPGRPEFEEEMQLIESYYGLPAAKDGPLSYRRHDPFTLLTNWQGEQDRARRYFGQVKATEEPSDQHLWIRSAKEVVFHLRESAWNEGTKAELRKLKPIVDQYSPAARKWLKEKLEPHEATKLAELWKEEA